MNNNPIGILDSGVGGLSVWKAIVQEMPEESTVYIADSKNAPYGFRPPEEIYPLAKRLIEFLITKQAKIIVVACNTITVNCLDLLRNDFPDIPLIGTVPVVKTASIVTKNNIIGILSTTRTSQSDYQKDLIRKFAKDCNVINVGTNELVPLIEKGITDGEPIREVLTRVLKPFQEHGIDTLALGCTHYLFVSRAIKNMLGSEIQILEPSGAIARNAKRILEEYNNRTSVTESNHIFYTTGEGNEFEEVVKKLLSDEILAKKFNVQKAEL
jgi:glutamate racemase